VLLSSVAAVTGSFVVVVKVNPLPVWVVLQEQSGSTTTDVVSGRGGIDP
jgi:hypothetical protein